MRTVTLRSLSSTIQTLNLTTQHEPRRLTVQRAGRANDGSAAVQEQRLIAPGVLTLLAGANIRTLDEALKQGAAKAGLPESVLEAPEVLAALALRPKVLEVIKEKPAAGAGSAGLAREGTEAKATTKKS